MLKAGLSQEIVIAKINASACEFDTSPAVLKALKTANIPEAVILAMVQAPIEMPMRGRTSVGSNLPRVQETTKAEVSAPARVDCVVSHADTVPVFSAPRTQRAALYKSTAALLRAYANIADELEPAGYTTADN